LVARGVNWLRGRDEMNASEGKEGREQESNMVKGNRMTMKSLVHVEKSPYEHATIQGVCLTETTHLEPL